MRGLLVGYNSMNVDEFFRLIAALVLFLLVFREIVNIICEELNKK